jgi:MFS family permease
MLACWGGWTLDGFDQQLYSYVVPTVIAVWGISTDAAGTIGTVTVVTSAFCGWFAGALADRFGRVRMLQIAILWYSVFTFHCSFAQNFERLFILRLARARLWRRVGHRCGADGRGHPRQV